jgi:hypothetical protein
MHLLLAVLALAQPDPWNGERRRVIVELYADRAETQATQARIVQRLPADLGVKRRFSEVPAMAAEVSYAAYQRLLAMPEVAAVIPDVPIHGALAQAVPAIRADLARAQLSATGKDVVVAVIDSGADFTHPSLAGSRVAEHCFTQNDCLPNRTSESASAADEAGHGTEVTGVVRSAGIDAPEGVAPGARIVAVRVLDHTNRGYVSDWLAGLEWVYQTRQTSGVRVVNMSLVTDALYTGSCATDLASFASLVTQVRDAGIVIFAASGNDGSSTQLTAPACLPGVVAVGATYDSDLGREPDTGDYSYPPCFDPLTGTARVACFSNTNATLRLLAPGRWITTTRLGGGTSDAWGTSFASPMAAGVAALMLELNPALTPQQIEDALVQSGKQVTDARNGLSFAFVDAFAALQTISSSMCAGKPDGTACQDGDGCTENDSCVHGACVGGAPKSCAQSACHASATCDPKSGACVGTPKPNGTPCDDGDLCTEHDACTAGECKPGTLKSCPGMTACRAASVCDPGTGTCALGVARPDGAACSDDDACTDGDTCASGECVGGDAVRCADPPACHGPGTCDPAHGMCTYPEISSCAPAATPQATEVTATRAGCATTGAPFWALLLLVVVARRTCSRQATTWRRSAPR